MKIHTTKPQTEVLIHQNEYYAVTDDLVITNDTKLSEVFNAALDNTPTGQIAVAPGVYEQDKPIEINSKGVEIAGPGNCGDLYFTGDDKHHGYSNKMPACFIADGFDAFTIGKENFPLGISLKNLLITGLKNEASMTDEATSNGAGIHIYKGNTLNFENIQVMRKHAGLNFETAGDFAYDNVTDKVHLTNIMLNYNKKGISQTGWLANVRAKNIWGYINQYNLIDAHPTYDWVLEDVFSNADSWKSTKLPEATINIETSANLQLIRPKIFGAKGTRLCQVPLLRFILNKKGDATKEWYSPHITVDTPELMETESDAIKVEGNSGHMEIRSPCIGLTSPAATQSWLGGPGTVKGSAVYNQGQTKVTVNGGYANCQQQKQFWFLNCKANNVENYT